MAVPVFKTNKTVGEITCVETLSHRSKSLINNLKYEASSKENASEQI